MASPVATRRRRRTTQLADRLQRLASLDRRLTVERLKERLAAIERADGDCELWLALLEAKVRYWALHGTRSTDSFLSVVSGTSASPRKGVTHCKPSISC